MRSGGLAVKQIRKKGTYVVQKLVFTLSLSLYPLVRTESYMRFVRQKKKKERRKLKLKTKPFLHISLACEPSIKSFSCAKNNFLYKSYSHHLDSNPINYTFISYFALSLCIIVQYSLSCLIREKENI